VRVGDGKRDGERDESHPVDNGEGASLRLDDSVGGRIDGRESVGACECDEGGDGKGEGERGDEGVRDGEGVRGGDSLRRDGMVDGELGLESVLGARRRSRHIPAAVRRTVFERDCGCCTFVDERRLRCRETRGLELHHRQPFAKQGTHSASNVTLYCQAHNALPAERDFGIEHVARHRKALRHETLVAELRAANQLSRETGPPR
jgi:hypothetical protein